MTATPPLPAVTIDPEEAETAQANTGINKTAMTVNIALLRAIPRNKHKVMIGVTVNISA